MSKKKQPEQAETEQTEAKQASEEKTEQPAEAKTPAADWEAKYNDLNDRYLRMAAEYDNFRKRSQREREQAYTDAVSRAVTALLPTYDNLERALKAETADTEYKKGVEMTMTQLVESLKGINVAIIDDGQSIQQRGQGNAGANGGPAGDLYVTVAIRPHPIFTRDGSDVYVEIPISFAQAALGDTLQVPTIDGRVEYKVPEGTQTGTMFRMRGKGIQNVNGRGRGDQYVRVNIEVPKNLSDKQKKLLREFEETSTDENQIKRKSFWDKVKDALKDK